MLKKLFLPTIFIVLAYGLWLSPDFKVITFGVAIFLFGMVSLEEGFKTFSGGTLERVLQKSTNKLYKSINFGIITTTLMQSSSLISVLTISFLGAGLISLYQGIGIILGANIGTTTGAWLMAGFGLKVDIASYAMPMLIFGVLLLFQNSKVLKGFGYVLTGLGFLFLGIHYMKEGFETFKDSIDLSQFAVPGFKGVVIFAFVGILATLVMQSSHATLIITLAALSAGQITYENSLALTIGANIGTTITAVLGSLSSGINGKRLAGAHFIFNVLTGIVAIFMIHQLELMTDFTSTLIGIADDDHTMKLAVFNTIFKVLGVIVFLPFINKLIKLLETVFKEKKKKENDPLEVVEFLNESSLEMPMTALIVLTKETKHLYEIAFKIIANGLILKRRNILSKMKIEEVIKDEYVKEEIDVSQEYILRVQNIYGEILDFSTRAQASMEHDDVKKIYKIKLANRHIVAAIKATQHLEKKMKIYTKSDNEYIKLQYNKMRGNLVKILRNIDKMYNTDSNKKSRVLVEKIGHRTKKLDVFLKGSLENQIRKNLITNQMATDLINNSIYAQEIAQNLLSMAEILFTKSIVDETILNNEKDETIEIDQA